MVRVEARKIAKGGGVISHIVIDGQRGFTEIVQTGHSEIWRIVRWICV